MSTTTPISTSTSTEVNPEWKTALDSAMHLSLMNDQKVQVQSQAQAQDATTLLPPPTPKYKSEEIDGDTVHSESGSESEDDSEDDSEDQDDRSEESEIEQSPRRARPPAPPARTPKPASVDESVKRRLSENELLQREEKLELLTQLHYYTDEKGFKPFKVLTVDDTLEDIRYEFFRAQRDINKKRSIKMMQKGLVTMATGVEMLTDWYNPLNLQIQGFSKSLLLTIREYDEVLEELHWKYSDAISMPPELKLAGMLGSALWFYSLSNKSATSFPQQQQDTQTQQPKMSGPRASTTSPSPFAFPGGGSMDPATLMCGLNMVQTLMNNQSI